MSETCEDLVHGFIQAIQKRGISRALLTDNGSAMMAEEFTAGLKKLGIFHETTLPYSPYQNGKQESFWSQLEGRFLAMLELKKSLTLKELNDYTQAWIEIGYNRKKHSETKETPLERFIGGKDISRESLTIEELRQAFRKEVWRKQRRSDGTVVVEGIRYEVPSLYGHLEKLRIQYARWDLGLVHLVDTVSGKNLTALYPLNVYENACSSRRRKRLPEGMDEDLKVIEDKLRERISSDEIPAILQNMIDEYAETGIPPAYLPQDYLDEKKKKEQNNGDVYVDNSSSVSDSLDKNNTTNITEDENYEF